MPLFLSLGEGNIALGAAVDSLLVVPARSRTGIVFFFELGKHMDINKDNNPTGHFLGSVPVPSQPFFGLGGCPGFVVKRSLSPLPLHSGSLPVP